MFNDFDNDVNVVQNDIGRARRRDAQTNGSSNVRAHPTVVVFQGGVTGANRVTAQVTLPQSPGGQDFVSVGDQRCVEQQRFQIFSAFSKNDDGDGGRGQRGERGVRVDGIGQGH